MRRIELDLDSKTIEIKDDITVSELIVALNEFGISYDLWSIVPKLNSGETRIGTTNSSGELEHMFEYSTNSTSKCFGSSDIMGERVPPNEPTKKN